MNSCDGDTLKYANVIFNNSRFLGLVCLFFFSCYTLTPLYHQGSRHSRDSNRLSDQNHQWRNIRMLLWDFVIAKLTHEEKGTTSPISVHVLLKKRRAVVNSGSVPEISLQSSENVIVKDQSVPSGSLFNASYHVSASGFYSRYSGLSPPVEFCQSFLVRVIPLLTT